MSGVQDNDRGFEAFKREMLIANGSYTKIGLQAESRFIPDSSGSTREGGEDMVTIGAAQEFGTDTTPQRSFIRSTTDDERDEVNRMIDAGLEKMKQGRMTAKHVLAGVGEHMESKIKAKIVAIDTPENAPSTIARKKSSNPLIDTGQTRQSIRHVEHIRGRG